MKKDNQTMVRSIGACRDVHIDTSLMPRVEVRILCGGILKAVEQFYEDPRNQQEFEAWLKTREVSANQ